MLSGGWTKVGLGSGSGLGLGLVMDLGEGDVALGHAAGAAGAGGDDEGQLLVVVEDGLVDAGRGLKDGRRHAHERAPHSLGACAVAVRTRLQTGFRRGWVDDNGARRLPAALQVRDDCPHVVLRYPSDMQTPCLAVSLSRAAGL